MSKLNKREEMKVLILKFIGLIKFWKKHLDKSASKWIVFTLTQSIRSIKGSTCVKNYIWALLISRYLIF